MAQISISASISSSTAQGQSISLSGELPDADVQKVRDLITDLSSKILNPSQGTTP